MSSVCFAKASLRVSPLSFDFKKGSAEQTDQKFTIKVGVDSIPKEDIVVETGLYKVLQNDLGYINYSPTKSDIVVFEKSAHTFRKRETVDFTGRVLYKGSKTDILVAMITRKPSEKKGKSALGVQVSTQFAVYLVINPSSKKIREKGKVSDLTLAAIELPKPQVEEGDEKSKKKASEAAKQGNSYMFTAKITNSGDNRFKAKAIGYVRDAKTNKVVAKVDLLGNFSRASSLDHTSVFPGNGVEVNGIVTSPNIVPGNKYNISVKAKVASRQFSSKKVVVAEAPSTDKKEDEKDNKS